MVKNELAGISAALLFISLSYGGMPSVYQESGGLVVIEAERTGSPLCGIITSSDERRSEWL